MAAEREVVYEDAQNALRWLKRYDLSLRRVVKSWENAQGFTQSIAQKVAALDEALEEAEDDEEFELEELKKHSMAVSEYLDGYNDMIDDVQWCWDNAQSSFASIIKMCPTI